MNWQQVAVAMACRVQYEQACGRAGLIREDYVRLALSEVFQSLSSGTLDFEYNHPDLPGNTRVDLLVRSPQAQNIETAAEVKWVRQTTETANRNWMSEILRDVFRVERLSVELAQGCQRVVVVVGEHDLMKNRIWNRKVNRGGGLGRLPVIEHLLQRRHYDARVVSTPQHVALRHADSAFRSLLGDAASDMADSLPSSYRIQLVGFHRADTDGIEAVIWEVTRARGQRWTFDSIVEWS